MGYYDDKLDHLTDLFGRPVRIDGDSLVVADSAYPIVDDVIVLLEPAYWPASVRARLGSQTPVERSMPAPFAESIQHTFGAEWTEYASILPEHEREFADYFDLIDFGSLRDATVCDLGCGSGRWSHFIAAHCREVVLVDFSDAIFVARRNLAPRQNALFFMADVLRLPFRRDFAALAFSLGVLHHLPVPALDAVARLREYAPRLLVYLYYALDNRPWHFRVVLRGVSRVRGRLSRIRSEKARRVLARFIAAVIYLPLVQGGRLASMVGLENHVPLYDTYRGKSLTRIEQDAYDRFFTSIEQRVTRAQIVSSLTPVFSSVVVSDRAPWWHFLCIREAAVAHAGR